MSFYVSLTWGHFVALVYLTVWALCIIPDCWVSWRRDRKIAHPVACTLFPLLVLIVWSMPGPR